LATHFKKTNYIDVLSVGILFIIFIPFASKLLDNELRNEYFQPDKATAHAANATVAFLPQFWDDRLISRRLDSLLIFIGRLLL
jgi:hypothetical protein